MIIWIKGALAFVKKYKVLLLSILLVGLLIFGGMKVNSWYENQLSSQYTQGVKDADAKWTKAMVENDKTQEEFRKGQQAYADDLQKQLAEERLKNALLAEESGKSQEEYANSDNGKKTGLDDKAVEIYNQSLGVKRE